jgi:hypothetical protein
MAFDRWVRAAALAVISAISVILFAPAASAGSLGVRDDTHELGPAQLQRVRDVLAQAPFDGRLVVTTAYPDAQELSKYVGSLVTAPNLVVVGLDPEHRHVQVHFGTGSGVPRSDWPGIERAGNDAFRRADWAGGVGAIFEAAAQSASGSAGLQAPRAQPGPVVAERPSVFGPGVVVLLVAAVVIGGLYLASRRRSAYGGYGEPPYGPGAGYGPGPGYGPGYPPPGGMGPLGGGLIGAGLGGLAGYELGKAEGEREERVREREDAGWDRGNDWGGGGSASGDDYDAGGGGSSWDDGGGGGDGGGGDSGGGSDF